MSFDKCVHPVNNTPKQDIGLFRYPLNLHNPIGYHYSDFYSCRIFFYFYGLFFRDVIYNFLKMKSYSMYSSLSGFFAIPYKF